MLNFQSIALVISNIVTPKIVTPNIVILNIVKPYQNFKVQKVFILARDFRTKL
eukprot:TRINITY_DN3645_c0_g1_i1.p2 TRINITY_DN3645_c0_g1~~TRINITY_DN3645_c0_g1_i1.p2  ORF type:complete len:53 (+),score=4.80 TRINITY_DN3645_c0_g1_i1:250-408(+)